MTCDRCKNEMEALLTLTPLASGEKRWRLCRFCVALVELVLRGSKPKPE